MLMNLRGDELLKMVQQLESVEAQLVEIGRLRGQLRAELNKHVLYLKRKSDKKTLKFHDNGKLYVLVPDTAVTRGEGLIDMHISEAPSIYQSLGEKPVANSPVLNPSPTFGPDQERDSDDF